MGKPLDLIGKRFGYLTVIEKTKKRKNACIVWKCRCDCGNIVEVRGTSLKNGNTKSCGCKKNIGLINYNNSKNTIQIGNRYGKLIVIKYIGLFEHSKGHRRKKYLCQCDCGNIVETWGYLLVSGSKSSCGCLCSKGEEKIKTILLKNNILFKHDYCIPELYKQTGRRLRYDFVIYNEHGDIVKCIEFDGRQHTEGMDNGVWKNGSTLEEIQERDNIKNNFCFQNNIILIRIPFTKLKTLNKEDVLTNKFEVKRG